MQQICLLGGGEGEIPPQHPAGSTGGGSVCRPLPRPAQHRTKQGQGENEPLGPQGLPWGGGAVPPSPPALHPAAPVPPCPGTLRQSRAGTHRPSSVRQTDHLRSFPNPWDAGSLPTGLNPRGEALAATDAEGPRSCRNDPRESRGLLLPPSRQAF